MPLICIHVAGSSAQQKNGPSRPSAEAVNLERGYSYAIPPAEYDGFASAAQWRWRSMLSSWSWSSGTENPLSLRLPGDLGLLAAVGLAAFREHPTQPR